MSEMEHNGAVIPAEQRPIEVITEEILFYKRQAGGAIIEIGRRLIEAKERLSHGEWLPWLSEKVDVSERSAQNFMRLAREYEKSAEIADLGASKALALLALPVSEREGFAAEKHLVNGEEKSVADMTAAELKQAIKERDEAHAELSKAEKDREKMAADMKFLNERLAGLDDEVVMRERELEELRNTPRQVAVETVVDQEAVKNAADAARREAEEALKAKIEQAEKAKARAEKEKNKVEQDLAAMKVAQEEAAVLAGRERRGLEEQVQVLQKKLAVASSSEMTVFKLHFDQGQESLRKMTGCIERMEEAGDAEGAGKLKKAMRALLEAALGGL